MKTMGDDKGLTHQDLARAAGVSVTTIKGYRDKFPGCFPVLRQGKPLRFDPRASEACLAIRQGFLDGLSVEQLRERLRLRLPWSWRHPLPEKPAISADLQRTVQDLARTVVRLSRAQAETLERLERLEGAVGGASGRGAAPRPGSGGAGDRDPEALRRDLDAASRAQGAALERLDAEVRALGQRLAALPPQDARVVRIRDASGQAQRYALHRLPPEDGARNGAADPAAPGGPQAPPSAAGTAAGAPPGGDWPGSGPVIPAWDLPLTVRSARGEYLGLAGPGGHLSVRGFVRLVARGLGLAPESASWSGGADGWRLDLGDPPTHSLDFCETTTPRGNRVALVQAMRIDGQPQDAEALVELLRTLRQQFAEN